MLGGLWLITMGVLLMLIGLTSPKVPRLLRRTAIALDPTAGMDDTTLLVYNLLRARKDWDVRTSLAFHPTGVALFIARGEEGCTFKLGHNGKEWDIPQEHRMALWTEFQAMQDAQGEAIRQEESRKLAQAIVDRYSEEKTQ